MWGPSSLRGGRGCVFASHRDPILSAVFVFYLRTKTQQHTRGDTIVREFHLPQNNSLSSTLSVNLQGDTKL